MKSRIKIFAAALAVSVATVGAAFWGGVVAWLAAWGCVAALAAAYEAGARSAERRAE
jgi:hypothetical protein